ncbi:MAG: hypothetical protein A2Z72_01705 [Omnitrophica bacterium RBG_13_46_9]|nr:MAG: hypothetical protein A2Z72_01705 [Omnitrophica bacterium RBG_13_46_9]
MRSLFLYRAYLYSKGYRRPVQLPDAPWHNAVLLSRDEWEGAVRQVSRLRLVPHFMEKKNWDSLAMLDYITKHAHREAAILDAGASHNSSILKNLFLYGYKNLTGINLSFRKTERRGVIRYEFGDLTRTKYPDRSFDVVTCQSVIEHVIEPAKYFREMARILKPGGSLITSTDYRQERVDTSGIMICGAPWKVFCREGIQSIFEDAEKYSFKLTGPINLRSGEMTCSIEGVSYTYIVFTMRKTEHP